MMTLCRVIVLVTSIASGVLAALFSDGWTFGLCVIEFILGWAGGLLFAALDQ